MTALRRARHTVGSDCSFLRLDHLKKLVIRGGVAGRFLGSLLKAEDVVASPTGARRGSSPEGARTIARERGANVLAAVGRPE